MMNFKKLTMGAQIPFVNPARAFSTSMFKCGPTTQTQTKDCILIGFAAPVPCVTERRSFSYSRNANIPKKVADSSMTTSYRNNALEMTKEDRVYINGETLPKKKKKKKRSRRRGGCSFKKACSKANKSEADVPDLRKRLSECGSEDSFNIEFSNSCSLEEGEQSKSDNCFQTKQVSFAPDKQLCQVHVMNKWDFAYRAARKGPWEEMARDRDRFRNRIRHSEALLSPIFNTDLRNRVYKERFAGNK